MFGLGVLADHHWTVCVPLPITRQRGLFCLLVCCGTPSCYGVGAFFLPISHGMHLTTFIWSGCTYRPSLDRLYATHYYQTKRTILFISLPGIPSWYGVGAFSLPISHSIHLVAPTQLCSFGRCVILTWHFPQKSPGKNLKIGFLLSPPSNHALLPLTYDLITSCIGWVQAGEVWALPSFHMCPKSTCCSLVHYGLEACLHSLSSVFWPFL